MQITKEEIGTDLKRILVEELFVEIAPQDMRDSDSLTTDIGLDSVGLIELVSLLEDRYGLKVNAQQATAEMRTVGSAVDYVWNHANNGAGDEASPVKARPKAN